MLHARWRLTVATGISWIAGKLAGWLALSETIVRVTPTTPGSEKERVYALVCVCVCRCVYVCVRQTQFGQGAHIYTTQRKDKKLLPYKVLWWRARRVLFCSVSELPAAVTHTRTQAEDRDVYKNHFMWEPITHNKKLIEKVLRSCSHLKLPHGQLRGIL